jgi:HEAT repeat protein
MAIDYEENEAPVTDEALATVAALAEKQLREEAEVERLEALLKDAKEQLRHTSMEALPTAMDEVGDVGLTSFELRSGHVVSVEDKLSASIPKKNKSACAKWLEDNGHESIVRKTVTLSFGRGEEDALNDLCTVLEDEDFCEYEIAEDMNTTTIKALCKELMEDGEEFPLKLFGIYEYRQATVEIPKRRKRRS